jgi:hypothetical protein
MSIRRITISVPQEVAGRIKKAARPKPVSVWVTDLIEQHLDQAALDRQWEAFCRDVAPTAAQSRRADRLFRKLTRKPSRRGAA